MREPAKTRSDARARYVGHLQKPLSCLTKAIWITGPTIRGDAEDTSLTLSEDPIRLPRKDGLAPPLYLSASQRFRYVEDDRFGSPEWKVSTRAYIYAIEIDAEEGDRSELLSWHWHPTDTPERAEPHAHARDGPLSKLHIPTGRVSFEQVIRFLVSDLGVEPIRDDWATVVADSERRFVEYRTWQ